MLINMYFFGLLMNRCLNYSFRRNTKLKEKKNLWIMNLGDVVYATTHYVYDLSREGEKYLLLQQIIQV